MIFSHWADDFWHWWKSDSAEKPAEKPAAPAPADPQKAAADAKKEQAQRDEKAFNDRDLKRMTYQPDTRKEAQSDYAAAKETFDKKTPAQQKFGTQPVPATEDEVKRRVAGKMIRDEYIADAKDRVTKDPKAAVGDLNSADGKLAFLKGFTQQDSQDTGKKENESYCGPTAIIAAAVYMNGPKGVTPLIDKMKLDSKDTFKGDKKKIAAFNESMKEIQERANKGELTNGDMDVIKDQLYNSMHRQQEKDQSLSKDDQQMPGIHEQTMKDYLDLTGLNEEMAAKHLDIRNIDNDGDGTRNHYVFRLGADKSTGTTVYDPYSRKGGQLVTAADEVGDYNNTRWATLHSQE